VSAGTARPVHSFAGLCAAYLGSPEFKQLAPRTQKLNRLYVDQLRERYGDLPTAGITRPVVRRLRDAMAAQPVKANRTLATLRLVLGHGVQIGTLKENAAAKAGRLRESARTSLYTDAQIERFLAAAEPALRRAMALMLYTVQRPSDVLSLSRSNMFERDGRTWIRLRQAKTRELVEVPLHAHAVELLADPLPPPKRGEPVSSTLLVPSPTGRVWSFRNFARAWDRARRRADYRLAREMFAAGHIKEEIRPHLLAGRQRRDLRRTGMVKMAQGGATPSQIAAVSGHTIDACLRILDTYIPRRGEVALGAIEAWERGAERGQIIALPAGEQSQKHSATDSATATGRGR
jgi:integrase